MMPNNRISVLIADDHVLVREGLRAILRNEKDIQIIAEAGTGREAVELAKCHAPTVVVMDLVMPVLNGFEAIKKIREHSPDTKFIVLTAYCDEEYIDRCLGIGIEGFVSKENSYLMLCKAIREAVAGRTFFCPTIMEARRTERFRRLHGKAAEEKARLRNLTSRELQVLRLVAGGAANKQIASNLSISVKTVEKHRQQLMDKLDIHDTASLTRFAISAGVVDSAVIIANDLD